MFGKRVKELRKKAKMTQEELAELLTISPQAVSRWETGMAMPDISLLAPLATILDTSTDYLLGMNLENDDKVVQELIELPHQAGLLNRGDETLDSYRREIKKHPRNMELKEAFLSAIQVIKAPTYATDPELAREVTDLCEDLMDRCPNRNNADLISLISLVSPRINNAERVKLLTQDLGNLDDSYEVILTRCTQGEERVSALKKLIYQSANQLILAIYELFEEEQFLNDRELDSLDRATKVIDVLYGEDFARRYLIKPYLYNQVECYLKRGDRNRAISALEHFVGCVEDVFLDYDLRKPELMETEDQKTVCLMFLLKNTAETFVDDLIDQIENDFSQIDDPRVSQCIERMKLCNQMNTAEHRRRWLTAVSEFVVENRAKKE